jgi:hypothetical protein
MMQESDNRATLAVLDRAGGFGAVNGYAAAIGATSTSFNHVIGCPDGARNAPNRTTLRDVARIFELAAGRQLGYAGFRRFRSLMATAPPSRVRGIVRGRAARDGLERVWGVAGRLRMSSSTTSRFLAKVQMAWKDGRYTLCDTECRVDQTLGGWVSIPFKNRWGRIHRHQFVFAAYAEDVPDAGDARDAWDRSMEMLRPAIRQALKSWKRARR